MNLPTNTVPAAHLSKHKKTHLELHFHLYSCLNNILNSSKDAKSHALRNTSIHLSIVCICKHIHFSFVFLLFMVAALVYVGSYASVSAYFKAISNIYLCSLLILSHSASISLNTFHMWIHCRKTLSSTVGKF